MPLSSSAPNAPDTHRIGNRASPATPQPAALVVSAGGAADVPAVWTLRSRSRPFAATTIPSLLYSSRPSRSGTSVNAGLRPEKPPGVLVVVKTPATEVYCVFGISSETWPVHPGASVAVARICDWRTNDWLRL